MPSHSGIRWSSITLRVFIRQTDRLFSGNRPAPYTQSKQGCSRSETLSLSTLISTEMTVTHALCVNYTADTLQGHCSLE